MFLSLCICTSLCVPECVCGCASVYLKLNPILISKDVNSFSLWERPEKEIKFSPLDSSFLVSSTELFTTCVAFLFYFFFFLVWFFCFFSTARFTLSKATQNCDREFGYEEFLPRQSQLFFFSQGKKKKWERFPKSLLIYSWRL